MVTWFITKNFLSDLLHIYYIYDLLHIYIYMYCTVYIVHKKNMFLNDPIECVDFPLKCTPIIYAWSPLSTPPALYFFGPTKMSQSFVFCAPRFWRFLNGETLDREGIFNVATCVFSCPGRSIPYLTFITLEFVQKDWLLRLVTLEPFDQSDDRKWLTPWIIIIFIINLMNINVPLIIILSEYTIYI